jgi:hypothetical protein
MRKATYDITFKLKDKQDHLAFIARSQTFAIAYLLHIYAGIKINILYVVCNGVRTEI